MSSFLIDKEEYVKCFGLIAGIAAANNIKIYSYLGQLHNEKTLYKKACDFYKWNLASIRKQYPDYTWTCDRARYTDDFFYYASAGAMLHGDDLKKAILEIEWFFKSSLYQVEEEDLYNAMKHETCSINEDLKHLLYDYKPQSWGSLDLDSILATIA